MDIQKNDTLLTFRHSSPAKKLAEISANGEIWIDPEITLDECRLALTLVLEDYARKLIKHGADTDKREQQSA